GGGDVEPRPEGGQVVGLGGEHRLRDQPHERTAPARAHVPPDPRLERLPVQAGSPSRGPRRFGRDAAPHPVDAPLPLRDVGERGGRQPRDAPGVLAAPAADLGDVPSLVVGRERGQPQLVHQGEHRVLPGADPLAADLDRLAAGQRVVQEAAADPVPGLQDDRVVPVPDEVARRDQSRDARADDRDIDHGHLPYTAYLTYTMYVLYRP